MAALSMLVFPYCAAPEGSETTRPGIVVKLDPTNSVRLKVTLRSGAHRPVTIPKYRLPWEWRYGLILVAVLPNGAPIDAELPVEDPIASYKITLAPNEQLTGYIDLQRYVRGDVKRIVRNSDVHIFWTYAAPEELRIPRVGGWVFVPQQK